MMKSTGVEYITYRSRVRLCNLIMVLMVLGFSSVSLYAESLVKIDVYVGFNGAFQVSKSTPVRVRIRNEGPSLKGNLYLRRKAEDGTILSSANRYLELPRGSRKEISFLVHLQNTSEHLQVGFQDGRGFSVVQAVDLGRRWYTRPLVVVSGASGSFDFLLKTPLLQQERLPLAYIHPEDLPVVNHGYEGVRILVLHDLPPADIDTARVNALTSWVDAGGLLIFSYGGNVGYLSNMEAPLFSLFPASTAEIDVVDTLEVSADPPITVSGPLPVIHTENGGSIQPARKKYGLGSIFLIPFDATPAVLGAATAVRYWTGLLSGSWGQEKLDCIFSKTAVLHELIVREKLSGFPGRRRALFFVPGYLALFCMLLLIVRTERGRRTAWAIYTGAVVIGSVTAFLLFYHPGKGSVPVMTAVSCIQGSSGRYNGSVETSVRLFSPSARSTEFIVPEGTVPVSGNIPLKVRIEKEPVLEGLEFDRWGLVYFNTKALIPLGVQVEIEQDLIKIENRGIYDIHNLYLIKGQAATEIGTLFADEQIEVIQRKSTGTEMALSKQIDRNPVWKNLDKTRGMLLKQVFALPNFLSSVEEGWMVLLGFVDDPVLSGSPVNGGWNINYQNLVIIRIPPAGGA